MRASVIRGLAAATCFAMLVGTLPTRADTTDASSQTTALMLFSKQTCAQRALPPASEYDDGTTGGLTTVAQTTQSPAPDESPSPESSPSPQGSTGPTPIPAQRGPGQGAVQGSFNLVATPRPQPGSSANVTPPPIPTPTPEATPSGGPIFLIRGGETPPPITPAGQATPTPSPEPTGVPTLAPGYVAVIADRVHGGTEKGQPGDADGNVHIFYADQELIGQHAHFDGIRTITMTGNPFLVNHTHDSVLTADVIVFDTIEQTAKLVNGNGKTAEGVVRGFINFSAADLHTDPDGTAHGLNPSVTTCDNPRAGYHITGKTMDVIPGDRIVINKAVLWLGAAAIFYLPRLVIPLRSVQNQRTRAQWFPEIGYDSYWGAYIKVQVPFGKDQYYYGYYTVNYFTKGGLALGYVGFFSSRRGRRTASVNIYEMNDRLQGQRTYNVALQEQENFDPHLHGNFQYNYQSNYGQLSNIPPNENYSAAILHQTQNSSQNYSFSHGSTGTQASSNSLSISDTRQYNQNLNQTLTYNVSNSSSNYVESSFSSSSEIDYLLHLTTAGADYQMEYDKTYTQQPFGINKEPEFQVRPYNFFPHFLFPLAAQLTVGEYSEPSSLLATWRGDAGLVFGPAIARVFGSDFQATVNVDQYAYGTGDLKAAISQDMSLTTPIGRHIVNSITYSEANYNGPALVPFQYLDQQPTQNTKNAQDLIRFFNNDVYTASFGYSTNFDGVAQPLSYQITARPSARSVVLLGGSFIPGSGQGFVTTNLQLSTPFGRDAALQFVTDLQWKGGELFSNKIVYYTKTIGNCYQLQLLYNESLRSVNVGLNLLAFPNQTATFAIGQPGTIIPSTFNF